LINSRAFSFARSVTVIISSFLLNYQAQRYEFAR
jgi:hypothetical protein